MMQLFNGGDEGLTKIEEVFNLCPGQMKKQYLEKNVIAWARNAFTLLAMVDYPYPANFMADLPGYPVNVACSYMTGEDKLAGLANITSKCFLKQLEKHYPFTIQNVLSIYLSISADHSNVTKLQLTRLSYFIIECSRYAKLFSLGSVETIHSSIQTGNTDICTYYSFQNVKINSQVAESKFFLDILVIL